MDFLMFAQLAQEVLIQYEIRESKAAQRETDFIGWLDEQTGFLTWPDLDGDQAQPEEEVITTAVCEHGLAAWLCVGPSHYPMEGSY